MYSTVCGKVIIFSCPAWIFHCFHATKPPQGSRGNFRASCGKFSQETWGWSHVMHEVCCIYLKIDLFKEILHVKLPMPLERLHGSRMNPACVSHEKYFSRIYRRHASKTKVEPSRKLYCIRVQIHGSGLMRDRYMYQYLIKYV